MLISVRGKPVEVECLVVEDRTIVIRGRILRVARVFDDFLDSKGVDKPEAIIKILKENQKADIFTFLSRFSAAVGEEGPPDWQDRYHLEYEYEAAIRVLSFDYWWKNDIKKQTRRRIKKAEEEGITVREVPLGDQLLQGIFRIFNETPVRQGKKFWHYGKDLDQVNDEISTYSDRSIFIGAYWGDELIGFAKMINCEKFGRCNQLLSMVAHRNKPVTNALIAELVRTCERKGIPYLKYGAWIEGSLGDFKQNNGFKKLAIPRFYKSLTFRGRVALNVGIHRGVREILPEPVRRSGIWLRRIWYRRSVD